MASKPKLALADYTGVVAKATGTTADAEIEIARVVKRRQVRTKLGDLTELANSIKAQGVIEPIVLHAEVDGTFRLIAGERRLEASKLAGLSKIPAVIKRNLSERAIRGMQVTENNDREDLSPFDQAMGVIEDVEKYGFQEAVAIWNRSDAWVSKRVAVNKYAAPVRKLLEDELCDDLEVLHSLNQLHAKSEQEYNALAERLRRRHPVSREDAREKLASVKEWERQTKEHAARRVAAAAAAPANEPAATPTKPVPATAARAPARRAELQAADEAAPSVAEGRDRNAGKSVAQRAGAADLASQPDGRARIEGEVAGLREMLFDYGQSAHAHFGSLLKRFPELEYELPDGEWVLWSGFQTVVLPMLEALGPDRSAAYLRRVQQAIRSAKPSELWSELHPVRDGEDPGSESPKRTPVPKKPDGWTF
jgi:ParB family chromosome partitioning protein